MSLVGVIEPVDVTVADAPGGLPVEFSTQLASSSVARLYGAWVDWGIKDVKFRERQSS